MGGIEHRFLWAPPDRRVPARSYSRFPEVEIVSSTKAPVIIPRLDRTFAVHGIPAILRSDNGPPFNAENYSRYL